MATKHRKYTLIKQIYWNCSVKQAGGGEKLTGKKLTPYRRMGIKAHRPFDGCVEKLTCKFLT